MATTMKFLFDNSFDAEAEPQPAPVPAVENKYTDDDLSAAQQRAYAEGEAAGRLEALTSIEQACAKVLAAMATQLGDVRPHIDELRMRIVEDAVKVVSAAIRKIVPGLARRDALAEIEAMVCKCLQGVYEEPRVVVRAHETVIAALQGRIDALAVSSGFAGKIVLFPDDQLAQTDCRIEWADGGAERNLRDIWQQIDAALAHFEGSAAAAAPALGADSPDTSRI